VRKTGRQSKLTPDVHAAVVNAVHLGVPVVSAGESAGIAKPTLLEWIARGQARHQRPSTKRFADFADVIEKAQAEDEVRRIARLEQAARGGQIVFEKTTTYPDGRVVHEVRRTRPEWTTDAWVLERSRPEAWGRKASVDMRVQQADIEAAAAVVAEECGLTAQQVLEEAERILRKVDHAARRPPPR